jgi:hypothetical protein
MSSVPHVEEERWDRNRARQLFTRFAEVRSDRSLDAGRNGAGESEYDRLRNELVVAHLNLVRYSISIAVSNLRRMRRRRSSAKSNAISAIRVGRSKCRADCKN